MFRLIGVYSVVLHSWFGKPRYFFIWALLEHLWCDLKIQKVAVLFVAPSWPFLLQSFDSVNHKVILWMEQFTKVLPTWTPEEIHPRVCCYQASGMRPCIHAGLDTVIHSTMASFSAAEPHWPPACLETRQPSKSCVPRRIDKPSRLFIFKPDVFLLGTV